MYIPKYSEQSDIKIIEDFMISYPFATLISNDSLLEGNHYPFLIKKENDQFILWTHIAKTNPQWTALQKQNQCLVIFTGPHDYISPSYYKNPLNVPTWSYTAVHAQCEASIEKDFDVQRELMKELVLHFESRNQTNWKYELPEEFDLKLLNSIVWIKCKVNHIQAKFKLSQNRNKEDYESLVTNLKARNSHQTNELLKYMKV